MVNNLANQFFSLLKKQKRKRKNARSVKECIDALTATPCSLNLFKKASQSQKNQIN